MSVYEMLPLHLITIIPQVSRYFRWWGELLENK